MTACYDPAHLTETWQRLSKKAHSKGDKWCQPDDGNDRSLLDLLVCLGLGCSYDTSCKIKSANQLLLLFLNWKPLARYAGCILEQDPQHSFTFSIDYSEKCFSFLTGTSNVIVCHVSPATRGSFWLKEPESTEHICNATPRLKGKTLKLVCKTVRAHINVRDNDAAKKDIDELLKQNNYTRTQSLEVFVP